MIGVLVSSSCCNKIPQIGWGGGGGGGEKGLKQQPFLSHSSGDWEVQDQGASRFSSR